MLLSFTEWKKWFRNLPGALKWFPLLVLIRPVVDNFYYLKDVSPFLSPLYIVGVLTPLLAVYSIAQVPKPNYSRLDTYMTIFLAMIVVSCLALLISDTFSLEALEFTLKFSFPFYMYFFFRRMIRSKEDLHGIFQTFIYSTYFVIIIFCYELFINPINIQVSRGLERFQGSYADVMNYAIYMSAGILIASYAFIEKSSSTTAPLMRRIVPLIIAVILCTLLLFNIHHTASYVVFLAVMMLFFMHILKANFRIGLFIVLAVAGLLYLNGNESFDEKIKPLIATDISVYEGEKENEALLHGRVGRWMRFFDHFNSKSTFIQLFGLPLDMDLPYYYIAKGSHNDFVRTTMFNGYLGLILYVMILVNIGFRVWSHRTPMQFAGFGALAILLLYSISTTPLLYPPLMYVILPVFAILALPKSIMD